MMAKGMMALALAGLVALALGGIIDRGREALSPAARGAVALAVVGLVALLAVGTVILANEHDEHERSPIGPGSPAWVPRVPGSTGRAVEPGQCGQYNGTGWHRIECPRVNEGVPR